MIETEVSEGALQQEERAPALPQRDGPERD